MKLVSKLSYLYPMEDPLIWLKFYYPHQGGIDPVFAGRLAGFAKDYGKKILISSGYRSMQEQIESYKSTGGYQNSRGSWVGGNGYAARPGASWHQYRLAVDVADRWFRDINKVEATSKQTILIKYGIYKPLTVGNGKTVLEDWHIQPIELVGEINKQRWEPEVINVTVLDFQKKMGLAADGNAGPITIGRMLEELEKAEVLKQQLKRLAENTK